MQSVLLTKELAKAVRPRAGRVLLAVPRKAKKSASFFRGGTSEIILPETARDHRVTDTHQRAWVLKVGYGPFHEQGVRYPGVTEDDFQPGDVVIFRPLLMELNCGFLLTDVRRVDARIVR